MRYLEIKWGNDGEGVGSVNRAAKGEESLKMKVKSFHFLRRWKDKGMDGHARTCLSFVFWFSEWGRRSFVGFIMKIFVVN